MVPSPVCRTLIKPLGYLDSKAVHRLSEIKIVLHRVRQTPVCISEMRAAFPNSGFGNRRFKGNRIRFGPVGSVLSLAYTATRRRQRSTNRGDRRQLAVWRGTVITLGIGRKLICHPAVGAECTLVILNEIVGKFASELIDRAANVKSGCKVSQPLPSAIHCSRHPATCIRQHSPIRWVHRRPGKSCFQAERIDEVDGIVRHVGIRTDRIDHPHRVAAGKAGDASVVVAGTVEHHPRCIRLPAGVAVLRYRTAARGLDAPRIEALAGGERAAYVGRSDDAAESILQVSRLRRARAAGGSRESQQRLIDPRAMDIRRSRVAADATVPLGMDVVSVVE